MFGVEDNSVLRRTRTYVHFLHQVNVRCVRYPDVRRVACPGKRAHVRIRARDPLYAPHIKTVSVANVLHDT